VQRLLRLCGRQPTQENRKSNVILDNHAPIGVNDAMGNEAVRTAPTKKSKRKLKVDEVKSIIEQDLCMDHGCQCSETHLKLHNRVTMLLKHKTCCERGVPQSRVSKFFGRLVPTGSFHLVAAT